MPATSQDVAGGLIDALGAGASVGVAVHDEELRMLVISPSLADVSGTPAEAQLGRRLTEALPGEAGEVAEASLREVAATGRPFVGEAAVTAGRERGWLVHVLPLRHEGRRLVAVVAFDVTDRRAALERLQHSRRMLARAQRMARMGSWRWDVEEGRWHWSEELFRLAGLPPGDRPPDLETLLATVPEESREAVRRAARACLRDGRPHEVSFPMRTPEGRRRVIRGRGVPVRGPSGRVVRVEGFAQDVTELTRAESRQATAAILGRLALSGMPIEALLRHACEAVVDELELDAAVVAERIGDGGESVVRGVGGPLWQELHPPAALGAGSLTAYTLEVDAPVVVADWEREQRMAPPPSAGVRLGSSAAVPVRLRGDAIGVLSAHARRADGVRPDDVVFLETMANMVASAAERLRAEEEVEAQAAARGRLVAHALDAEDRARRAISEALHDGPLQDLLALGHDVARLRPAAAGDERHVERLRDGIGRALQQIREVMLDLHPVVLDVGGLEPALTALAAQHARLGGYDCGVEVEPEAAGARDELVLALSRELLRNVAKHASAREVSVRVARTGDGIALSVVDDGVGIAPGRARDALHEGHIGLASSRERVEAIGGSLRVGARPDGRPGTQAVAVLPDN